MENRARPRSNVQNVDLLFCGHDVSWTLWWTSLTGESCPTRLEDVQRSMTLFLQLEAEFKG